MQISIAERSIQEAREMGSDLLVRQYQKLKNEFIQQLNEMLKANMLGLKVIEDVWDYTLTFSSNHSPLRYIMTAQPESFIHSNAIIHLLSLIAASERTIKEAHEMGYDLIVRQYQHLRSKD